MYAPNYTKILSLKILKYIIGASKNQMATFNIIPIAHTTGNSIMLDDSALLRYSRHILLNEIDLIGQERLCAATILIVGCGGLGAAAIPILAAAGIGHLILIDDDAIELSNLQRQTLYNMADLGSLKAITAKKAALAINPQIKVTALIKRANLEDLNAWIQFCDVVLDCTDNFQTRCAINKSVVRHKKILISGAATRFEGQLSVFDLRHLEMPCYACLFEGDTATDGPCATFGVFAPLVHIIGANQAQEALKMILSIGISPIGQMKLYDALTGNWEKISFQKNRQCIVCNI